ncbi:hypothetical protein HID58_078187 [Brassica napus]|uniref:(rape) hypothetical protein n=1 Tax=Brassica napus TaxID=3708 RepID=A0A816N915_BRANA|nr:hypothetical protein HID58_078187 [Brassica napus]CAF2028180.1 unnamed protein product [Brassica napus]
MAIVVSPNSNDASLLFLAGSTASHHDLKEKASIHLDLHLTNSFLECLNLKANLNIYTITKRSRKSMQGVTRQ